MGDFGWFCSPDMSVGLVLSGLTGSWDSNNSTYLYIILHLLSDILPLRVKGLFVKCAFDNNTTLKVVLRIVYSISSGVYFRVFHAVLL